MTSLTWDTLANPAREIFNIWMWGQDHEWAKEAWNKLEAQGLTSYENDVERHKVLVRFLALGKMYHEFCEIAFEQPTGVHYRSWLSAFENAELYLSPIRLAQLLGNNFMLHDTIEDADVEYEILPDLIDELVEQQRSTVYVGLRNGYGSDSLLFAYLWLSAKSPSSDDADIDDVVEDVLNCDFTWTKQTAFSWVADGMAANFSYDDSSGKKAYIERLIAAGESETVEFKLAACVDIKMRADLPKEEWKKKDDIANKIVRGVAALLNSRGGSLLIGISDNGGIEGINIEYEVANPKKQNWDGYQLFLQEKINSKLDKGIAFKFYTLIRHEYDSKDICEIKIQPFHDLVFVDDMLYVKQGNRTVQLKGQDIIEYHKTRRMNVKTSE